jgi:hypothetical protein
VKSLGIAYLTSSLISISGALVAFSPQLEGTLAFLNLWPAVTLCVSVFTSLLFFIFLARKRTLNVDLIAFHGILASVIIPGLVAFSPLIVCIVLNGQCS